MSKYPKINYIGNKDKLVNWIIDNLPLKKGTVLDLFSGGNSVAYALKENNYTVYSNDALYSNYVISKAIIENKNIKLNEKILDTRVTEAETNKKYKEISFLSNRLYYNDEVRELAKLFVISEKIEDEYEKYMFLALIRRAMIRKLPYSRMNVPWNQIQKLRDEDYSYEKYKRRRAYHNFTFEKHIRDNLENYNNAVFDNKKDNKSFNYDSFDMIDNLKEKVDIIYMDPPYPATMNKYGDFYGLYDKAVKHEISYVNFSENNMFLSNLEKLIEKCIEKTKYIVISESNKTKPTVKELSDMLSKYGTVKVYSKEHQYKVTGSINKNQTVEMLIILKVKESSK